MAAIDPGERSLLSAAGGRAAATIVFHPRHWSMLGAAATQIAGELLPDELLQILSASGPWAAARAVAREERIELPRALSGWDDSRPILVAMFEPPDVSVADLLARIEVRDPPELIGHRLVIPATNAAALSQGLSDIARMADCENAPASVAEHFAGADAVLRCDDMLAVVEAGDGLVLIRVARAQTDEDDVAFVVPPALTRSFDSPVVVTPALRWAMSGPIVLAGHVRPERLRAALLTYKAAKVGRMAGHSSGDTDHAGRVARAKAELLGTILRTSPVGAEVDDVALGLITGRRPTFALVQGLTGVGVAAYDAGVETPVTPEGPQDAPLVVRSVVNVDVMQAVAGVPLGLNGIGDAEEAYERVERCGEPCYLHLLASRVFGLGALTDQVGLVRTLERDAGPIFRFEPAELPTGVTMELSFDFPTLAERLGGDRFTHQLAAGLGVVQAVQVRAGRTVMTTLRVGAAPPAPDLTDITVSDPGAQGSGRPRDEGAACAEAVAVGLETAMRRHARGSRTRGESAQQPDCASASDELRAVIGAFRELSEAADGQ